MSNAPVPSVPVNRFNAAVAQHGLRLRRGRAEILQLNVGKLCNLTCIHCHVNAGPKRKGVMTRETIDRIAQSHRALLDQTAPGQPNAGVGDIADIIRATSAGAVVDGYDDASLSEAIAQAEAAAREPRSIRAGAVRYFALETGVERYDAIYRTIGRPTE